MPESYTIKEGTKSVAAYAFANMVLQPWGSYNLEENNTLKSIVFPDSLEEIGMQAFSRCKRLTNVTLPANVKIIEDCAFWECSNIQEITLPSGITKIGKEAFANTGIETITTNGNIGKVSAYTFNSTPWQDSRPNGVIYLDNVLYKYKSNGSSNVTVEVRDGTTHIADGAFGDINDITKVILPNSIRVIGDRAFSYCHNLQTVEMGDNIKEIGESAFYYDENLELEKIVTQFDLDGETIKGNNFTMPAKNVVISNIVFGEQIVLEKTFTNQRLYNEALEASFEDDTAIKVTFDYDTTKNGTWLDVWLYDSNGIFIRRFSNTELRNKTLYVNDKGIKIVLRNWEELSEYKFKCIINKTDEIAYRGTETPHPYKGNSFYAFTTKFDTAQNIRVTFDEQSMLKDGDSVCMYDMIYNNEDDYYDTQKNYMYGETIASKEIILIPENEISMILYSNSRTNDTYGFKYYVERYETPNDVLESSHTYENGLYDGKVFTKTVANADMLQLEFNNETYFEWNCDRITIYYTDASGNDIYVGEYTGDQLSGQTVGVPANNVKIVLRTDGSVVEYGFRCKIKKAVLQNVGEPQVVETPHDYDNNQTYEYFVNLPDNVDGVKIEFDPQSKLESGFDQLHIYNSGTGDYLAYRTGDFSQNDSITLQNVKSLRFYMTTDVSVVFYGFKCTVTAYKYITVE